MPGAPSWSLLRLLVIFLWRCGLLLLCRFGGGASSTTTTGAGTGAGVGGRFHLNFSINSACLLLSTRRNSADAWCTNCATESSRSNTSCNISVCKDCKDNMEDISGRRMEGCTDSRRNSTKGARTPAIVSANSSLSKVPPPSNRRLRTSRPLHYQTRRSRDAPSAPRNDLASMSGPPPISTNKLIHFHTHLRRES